MNLNIWAWLKKRALVYQHQPIGSQNHCEYEEEDCTVEMNEQYRSTTSLKNLDANEMSYEHDHEAYYDTQRSYESAEQDDASLDDSLSTVKMSEFVLSSNSSRIHLIHEALEYERLIRTRRIDTRPKLG